MDEHRSRDKSERRALPRLLYCHGPASARLISREDRKIGNRHLGGAAPTRSLGWVVTSYVVPVKHCRVPKALSFRPQTPQDTGFEPNDWAQACLLAAPTRAPVILI